ncbi:hypothetical protein M8C21_023963 [Ambrosia artemisiifolia]|uniref:Large ribosomal subunit protein eL24-related N-terminal domain-containing protein n=1 Tax=Ambrosia artemisiifolia TaxID=4212 RepID=A0AAD5GGK6_AMBAR|nr:hypothetical protein M8C21_023963 [Ambrosia artemisiifolia]
MWKAPNEVAFTRKRLDLERVFGGNSDRLPFCCGSIGVAETVIATPISDKKSPFVSPTTKVYESATYSFTPPTCGGFSEVLVILLLLFWKNWEHTKKMFDLRILCAVTDGDSLVGSGGHHHACSILAKMDSELCRFGGQKFYPGRGIRFIRYDSQDLAQEAVKKRHRATKKPYSRAIMGATLEVIQKKRSEKPEVRDAAREAALREIKERIKKTKDEKKAKKAKVVSKQKVQAKGGNVPKGKGPKLGGGGVGVGGKC